MKKLIITILVICLMLVCISYTQRAALTTTYAAEEPHITQSTAPFVIIDNTIPIDNEEHYMYVTATALYGRTGPGVNFEAVRSFNQNTKLNVVQSYVNGWSEVQYGDDTYYVATQYLSDTQTDANTNVMAEISRRGCLGRLVVKDANINVAIFTASAYNNDIATEIINQSDSAAYMTDSQHYYGYSLIADHSHQDFKNLHLVKANTTKAVLDCGVQKYEMLCTANIVGMHNYRGAEGLFDANGNELVGKGLGDICMYTCNDDGSITFTFWKFI